MLDEFKGKRMNVGTISLTGNGEHRRVRVGMTIAALAAELGLDAFRKLEAVNVEGTLLALAEAGRHFALQGTGGDIVLISTKNVFAPGAGFGASGTGVGVVAQETRRDSTAYRDMRPSN